MADDGYLLCVTARVPAEGIALFQAYEAAVLPLLADHGARLERRLRSGDGTLEVHIIRFASTAGFDSFRADPRRAAVADLLTRSGATAEVVTMIDVA